MHERSTRSAQPPNFRLEATSVWSFPERGSWATHEGSYRGNWSPYVPRNLILRYTKPGDLVVDPFVGGGTTAIEAKLLGRRCLALDINPRALGLTRSHTAFEGPQDNTGIIGIVRADARALPLADNTVDLVCAHPPYANAIAYSDNIEGDLSHLRPEAFLAELATVAAECYRVIRPSGICAVLMGDARRNGNVVPLGLETLSTFRSAGFVPKEVAIKTQHNTRTEGSWRPLAAAQGFLLLAHEYLFIFRKPYEKTREK